MRQIDERLLDEPRHHARIGAAARDRRRPARIFPPLGEHGFAQCVVGTLFVGDRLVEIEADPGLDDGVDVERANLSAITHYVERGRIDREVDAETLAGPGLQIFAEHVAVIVAGDRQLNVADAALVEQGAVAVVGVDDDEMRLVELEMPLDQRQRAPADRPEADHHDRAVDASMYRSVRHEGQLHSDSRGIWPG